MELSVMVEVSEVLDGLTEYSDRVRADLVKALNKTATHARTLAAEEVRAQVNFPASYLFPSAGRLRVSERANKASLSAVISGRDRPTSLAQFAAKGTPARPKGGQISVSVKPGRKSLISRAFIVNNLNSGNRGLAVRTDGGAPPGAYKPTRLSDNVWLLYGPSVGQVLASVRNSGGVYEEIGNEVMTFLRAEFLRLQALGTN